MKKKMKHEWLENAPQTPLHKALNGKTYKHHVLCGCRATKPIGSPGCKCLGFLTTKKF